MLNGWQFRSSDRGILKQKLNFCLDSDQACEVRWWDSGEFSSPLLLADAPLMTMKTNISLEYLIIGDWNVGKKFRINLEKYLCTYLKYSAKYKRAETHSRSQFNSSSGVKCYISYGMILPIRITSKSSDYVYWELRVRILFTKASPIPKVGKTAPLEVLERILPQAWYQNHTGKFQQWSMEWAVFRRYIRPPRLHKTHENGFWIIQLTVSH